MAIQFRNSVLAIKVETTEGTPVVPAGATDFIAMQDDFTMSPSFEVLSNAELKASLGPAKPILGIEGPTCSFSHYLRHSGVEGQEPNYKELLQASLGAVSVAASEYDTVAASTTSVIKVDAGEGATFQRGEALLVKDATNGYSIVPIHSIDTDDLTLGFNLSVAPASGVNLGKAVLYYPANSGHQSLTVWNYLGNGGATQMSAGNRVVDASISIEAGQLINCSYSLEGIGYYFNPIEITVSNKWIDFDDGGGEEEASIVLGMYKDPHQLATAIANAMNALTTDTITVTYNNTTGKYTIASDGATLELNWKTGAHGADNTDTHIGSSIGYSDAADDTAALTYTSDNAISFAAPYTPSYDSSDPLVAKANQAFIGDADDNTCFAASSVTVGISTPKTNINSICAASGISGSIINARSVTISVSALLEQYEADKFRKYRENEETRFFYAFGTKSAGNWVPGKCGCIYVPTATITSFNLTNADSLVQLDMELTAYVDDNGNGEAYINFV